VGFNNFRIILNRRDGLGQARRAGNYLWRNAYSIGGHAPDNKPMRAGMASQGQDPCFYLFGHFTSIFHFNQLPVIRQVGFITDISKRALSGLMRDSQN
jgi:hypothetical protein